MAEWGHDVTGLEADENRLSALREGRMPFHEPGLEELVRRHSETGRLTFSADRRAAVASAQVVVICVGTHDGSGGWQTRTIRDALGRIVPELSDDAVLVVRSTLPPAFLGELDRIVGQGRREAGREPIPVLINPEFTREGQAVTDFLHPDRVVIGVVTDPDERGQRALGRLYRQVESPMVLLTAADAVLAKLGSNLFLATKISFANELAALCEAFGADVEHVVDAMALDPRIGGSFLRAGVGFGGSCLPHQVSMTIRDADEVKVRTPLLAAVDSVNRSQRERFVARLAKLMDRPLRGSRIALLGLTFKPGTDDLREAPSLVIARILLDEGAEVIAFDPMPSARARAVVLVPGLQTSDSALGALEDADAAGLLTEWPEFTEIDWLAARPLMRRPVVVDGRNALVPAHMTAAGYRYASFGRPTPEERAAISTLAAEPEAVEHAGHQMPARDLAGLRAE
jgi:UDPglucose 6-dehydrogenase